MAKKKADTENQAPDSVQEINFEASLEELESLVDQMESGELSLDESLRAFERGIKLTRQCQEALAAAELKVQMLTDEGDLEDIEYETE